MHDDSAGIRGQVLHMNIERSQEGQSVLVLGRESQCESVALVTELLLVLDQEQGLIVLRNGDW